MVTRKNGGKPDRKQGQKRRTVLTPDTPYGECSERLTAFGGLLALVKLADLIGFEKIFQEHFARPERAPKLGHYRMVLGFLLLLFVGFQRLGHFVHVRTEAMVCGTLRVACLPAVSTFWRHLASLGLPQAAALLKVSAACRQRVWALCAYAPKRVVVNIDTTSLTVYGDIQGAQKAYNPKHRGKPTLRPVLCFLEETREYLCGSQRRGATMSTRAVARQILQFRDLLPDCVESVHVKGDGEFISWNSIQACRRRGYTFTFGKGRNAPVFPEEGWYRRGGLEYNECRYQPFGWAEPCRFVASRERKKKQDGQLNLLKEDDYVVRCFVTDKTTRPHHVIADYDTRAGVEPLIGEAQREGLLAVPSKRFQSNHVFFQLVMLAYNFWRWMKLLAGHSVRPARDEETAPPQEAIVMPDQTLRTARLRLLYVAAKIRFHANRDEVLYSLHDPRSAGLMAFLAYLDRRRAERQDAA